MKKIHKLFKMFAMLSLIIGLAGCCALEETPENATALVLGVHQNFPKINLYTESVYQETYDAVYSYGDCSIVVVDGNPYVAASYNINKPDANIDNSKRKQIAKKNTEQIISDAMKATAKTPEIDTLSAITSSSALLKVSSAEVKKMLIYDSGLSTTGLLDFSSENLIMVDPHLIVERLLELHALPDLTGIKVLWTGLGEVCGEQDELTSTYKYNLKKIWQEILDTAGAEVVFVDIPLSTDSDISKLPPCKTIPIMQDTLKLSGNFVKPLKFGEDTIKFKNDQAIYAEEVDAYKALDPISAFLKENSKKQILVVGTTASVGDPKMCKDLSLARANTCKESLVEMGVDETQILTLGLGRDDCILRTNDLDTKGNLIESLATQNRAVYILDMDSTEAETLWRMK